ncbi:hypothetical protein [Vaginisenegalia massiliensis]|uniref:hypothetical protein n=1 Tax=Vaginisenegalia massiliensis TaxID=2058294 RepID=UPI000F52C302|nr:hypothetical protein [Vaginisenegalia massiliensis]
MKYRVQFIFNNGRGPLQTQIHHIPNRNDLIKLDGSLGTTFIVKYIEYTVNSEEIVIYLEPFTQEYFA